MASTSRRASSILYPSRELMQELDDVKNLLQMTLDETKAWCNDNKCLGRAEDATQTISTQDQTENVRREASSTSRTTDDNDHEGSPNVRDSSVDHYSQLRQAIEESHQNFLASIHGVHQNLARVQDAHHAELIQAIQERRPGPVPRQNASF